MQDLDHLDDLDQPTLLVVDDDPDILRVVRFYLSKQKYRVISAASGREALEALESEHEVELILSDVMMPDMSGLDLLTEVRRHPRCGDVPVILISAEGETSKKVAGLNLGADDFITKPFNFDELLARVKNHIRLRRLQKEVSVASKQYQQANDLLREQNDRFQSDLEAARVLQMSLLPQDLPNTEQFRVGACYKSAERLGGDFFDVVPLNGGRSLGVLIADVCGHGVTAAFVTAMTKISFQGACYASPDPAAVLSQMNRELTANLQTGFVTVFYAIYDVAEGRLRYASGGHPPVLIHRRTEGRLLQLEPQAPFLGAFDEVEFRTDSAEVRPGDRLVFYTDGLFESQRAPDEDFGLARVSEVLQAQADLEIQPALDGLLAALEEFMGATPPDDDITMVGLDVLPAPR